MRREEAASIASTYPRHDANNRKKHDTVKEELKEELQ